jgi:hypothetical protein
MMLPRVPGGARKEFMTKIVETLMNHGTQGISEEDFTQFKTALIDRIQKAKPTETASETPAGKG